VTAFPLARSAQALLVAACCLGAPAQPAAGATGPTRPIHAYPGLRVPAITVTQNLPGTSAGSIFLTPRARPGVRPGAMILDSQGRVVWYHQLPVIRAALGLDAQTYDGRRVLTWAQRPRIVTNADLYAGNPRFLYNVIADERYRVIARVRALGRGVRTDLHEMVITPKGTALVVGFRFLQRDLSRYGGNARGQIIDSLVQEIDIKTGRRLFSWSAANNVALGDSVTRPPATADGWDWFHVNAVSEDSDGNLLVTARHTSAVYKIDRTTGRVIWKLGGNHSTFTMGPGAAFWYPHDARRQSDGSVTIFDNHATEYDKTRGGTTRVIRLALSTKTKTATLVQSVQPPQGNVLAGSQGSARSLPGGNLFVGWGNTPWFSEHSPQGEVLFAAHLPSQTYQSYRALKGEWHAQPDTKPAAVAIKSASSLLVYAAWNGATEIARWRVMTGPGESALQEAGGAPWNGLETRMRVPSSERFVRVDALDAAGAVLGSSPIVTAR
jgi:outer membrane protein assembly factor BamB